MIRRTWRAALCAVMLTSWVGLAQAQTPAGAGGKVAAVVNGVAISMADVEAAVRMGGPIPANLPDEQRLMRMMQARDMLIDNMLMQQFLDKQTPPVNPEEVNKRLADLVEGLKKDGKSLAELLRDTNRTIDQLRAEIADYLRWTAFTAQKVTDAQVEGYYREYKDVFDKVSVRASHIMLRVPSNASEADKAKVRAKLLEIRMTLINDPKADFTEMAKHYSRDPQASQGGDLGWFPRKWVFEESFSRAAFALKVGQISDVVETEFGYHLIKVTDRRAGEKSEFGKIKDAVREFYLEDLRQQILADLRKTARIELVAIK